MKILIFLHGTTIMHKSGLGRTREWRVRQVVEKDKSIFDYASYVPVGDAVKKLQNWKKQGAEILYLSSHENSNDVEKDKFVLRIKSIVVKEFGGIDHLPDKVEDLVKI